MNSTSPPYSIQGKGESTPSNVTVLGNNSGSDCIDVDILYSDDLYRNANLVEKIFMFVCAAATLCTLIDFIDNVVFVLRRYRTSNAIKYKSLQIIGIYSAVSVATLFALFIPQADLLCELLITVYISRSMFHFVSLMTLYFGGKERLLHRIKNDKISFQSPPLCCCCCCLPKIAPTDRNFRVLKVLVLQAAIFQPLLNLATVVLWLDGKYIPGELSATNAFSYLIAPTVISTLLSLYAFNILYRLCQRHLVSVEIKAKFGVLQLVIVFTRLQAILMSILAAQGIPACRGILSTQVLSQTYKQIIIILEMFLMAQLARRVYRNPHDQVAILVTMELDDGDAEKPEVDRDNPEVGMANGGHFRQTVEAQPLGSTTPSVPSEKDDSRESKV